MEFQCGMVGKSGKKWDWDQQVTMAYFSPTLISKLHCFLAVRVSITQAEARVSSTQCVTPSMWHHFELQRPRCQLWFSKWIS